MVELPVMAYRGSGNMVADALYCNICRENPRKHGPGCSGSEEALGINLGIFFLMGSGVYLFMVPELGSCGKSLSALAYGNF